MISNPWRRDERPLVIAHRGHSVEYPENTLAAYRKAIELGVEMIECDVNITRDGRLVMIHDWTLDRTTDGAGPVNAATWDEIQRLDAGAQFNPGFAGQQIPSTEATIRLFREAGIYGCFEVKGESVAAANEIASALADLLVQLDALEANFISSYYHEALAVAQAKVPNLKLAPERLPDDAPPDPPEALRQAQALDAPVLQHQHLVLTADVTRLLHENDIAVWSWNTETEASIMSSLAAGVDGLMGDDVRLIVETLNRVRPALRPT